MISPKKILVIDDDEEDRMLMHDMFAEIGVPEIAQFEENGEKALSYLEQLEKDALPNVIVLDLNMPKLNGTQVLRILKNDQRFKNITVIIYSTSVNTIEKEETINLGAHSYIIKPISYEECLEKVKYFQQLSESENILASN
jgi:two-component system response regulator